MQCLRQLLHPACSLPPISQGWGGSTRPSRPRSLLALSPSPSHRLLVHKIVTVPLMYFFLDLKGVLVIVSTLFFLPLSFFWKPHMVSGFSLCLELAQRGLERKKMRLFPRKRRSFQLEVGALAASVCCLQLSGRKTTPHSLILGQACEIRTLFSSATDPRLPEGEGCEGGGRPDQRLPVEAKPG